MKNSIIIFILIISLTSVFAQSETGLQILPKPFQIIPQPEKIEILSSDGMNYGVLSNLKILGEFNRPVMGNILDRLTESRESETGTLLLRIDTSGIAPDSKEGYVLTILKNKVEIVSRGEAGIFYGCQSLEQLLEDARDFGMPIPECKITDTPALTYRSVHFDLKHHLDHMNVYYESMDRLARYKINAVIFEFEDKLRYRRQPLVGAPQAISIDEMAALTKYAAERHIEITPLVQGLGHATFILKHDKYAPLRELPENRWAFCPLDEGSYDVLFDLYRDAFDATPGSRYLHVGGDEIGNIGLCYRCKPTADKEGLLSLNLYWLNRVSNFAQENGRIPIFWDDMPLKEAGVYQTTYKKEITFEESSEIWKAGVIKLEELIPKFPKNCVYMRWNYSMATYPGNLMALDWYLDNNLKVMISTAANSGPAALFPFDDSEQGIDSRGIGAIRSFIQIAAEKGIEGMLSTAWDDRSPHLETYWRGLIASAEYSWSPNGRSLQEYDLAYLQKEFGTSLPNYVEQYKMLREASLFWEGAFNENGNRLDRENALFILPGISHSQPPKDHSKVEKKDFNKLLIVLPDTKNPGKWSDKYASRLNSAKLIIDAYPQTSKSLNYLNQTSKKNRYHWEVFIAINDFQIAAPRLLLAMEQCDTKKRKARSLGVEKTKEAMQYFYTAWKNLQNVYEKTRFISYPVDYVPDRYYHFASQREDLSWMIQVEELLFPRIEKWIKSIESKN